MTSENEPQIKRIPCNSCGRETNHGLLYTESDDQVEHDDNGGSMTTAVGAKEVLKCRGCGELTMRVWSEGPPEWGDRSESYYPPRVSRRQPIWLDLHPDEGIQGLLREVYTALYADQRRLAMMGCRAIVDRVLVQAVGDEPNDNFAKKLDRMVVGQLLSQSDRKILEAAIDAGHASAHRGNLPNPKTLSHVVSIVEHLVQAGRLRAAADEVRKATPRRPRAGDVYAPPGNGPDDAP